VNKKERVQRKGVVEEEKGGKGETLGKPYPREKKKNEGKQRNTRTAREHKKVNSPRQFIHTSQQCSEEGESARAEKPYL